MYKIYKTRAIIIERSLREHQVSLVLFTELFGVVYCVAQGAGKLSSKNRPHLGTLDLVTVSLVRGVRTWRLVGAELDSACPVSYIPFFARITDVLRKIIPKEEIIGKIFSRLAYVYVTDIHDARLVEIWLIAHMLIEMGYIDPAIVGISQTANSDQWDTEIVALDAHKTSVLVAVNKGLSYAISGKRM